jgi:hypothetical protein
MDSIDVTSPEFSLEKITNLNEVISDKISLGNIYSDYSDYAIYIFIGVTILISVIAFFIYKFYTSRGKRVTFQEKLDECYGDVCQR